MAKIKVISNPYKQLTVFESWDPSKEAWVPVTAENCPNSKLLNEELKKGFFPFKVRQIVDILIEEYSTDSDRVEVVFEGTEDEYRELESICSGEGYSSRITSDRSELYLENARDILPDVVDVFKAISSIVEESTKGRKGIQKELDRFSDASDKAIPICVIGNYSSGKSTFINALVGYELLPSSDEPTTAKIYRISQSDYTDRARIRFDYEGKEITIQLRAGSYRLSTDAEELPMLEKIEELLEEILSEPIPVKLNSVLNMINTFANSEDTEEISDLIRVEAPFDDDGIWGKTKKNFVIFDTPGSNSASNRKHYDVLKKAMADLTNGLPIFISEFDSLDSTDNDKLYQDINNMEELDNRFTMIIVNKADSASLKKGGYTEEDRNRILSLAIPRKLYAGGIYFVSSVMGLGAKNDENFISDHNAEIFEDQKGKYTNPNSRFYKTLYQYNILPAQIQAQHVRLSQQHPNLIYANSGLYSIEQAICTFADVYSHYNKCQQSELFLNKVIDITFSEISEKKKHTEEYRERLNGQLERDKAELLQAIDSESEDNHERFLEEYREAMRSCRGEIGDTYTAEELHVLEEQLRESKTLEKDVDGKRDRVMDFARNLGGHLLENVSQAIREKDLYAIRGAGAEAAEDYQKLMDGHSTLRETQRAVNKEASDDLLMTVKDRFVEKWTAAQQQMEAFSTEFCTGKTEEFKKMLLDLVTGSTALSEAQRSKLAGIIVEYHPMDYQVSADALFDKSKFLHRIFGDTDRLAIYKLTGQYNRNLRREVDAVYEALCSSHKQSFDAWRNSLVALIRENIVEFSPELYNQSKLIEEEGIRIRDMEKRIGLLQDYSSQIRQMMAWKEA